MKGQPLQQYISQFDTRTPAEGGLSAWSEHGSWLRYRNMYVETGEDDWLRTMLAWVDDDTPLPAYEPLAMKWWVPRWLRRSVERATWLDVIMAAAVLLMVAGAVIGVLML